MPRGTQMVKDKSDENGPKKRVRTLDAPAAAALPPS
jgi:hypothetical protein